jgi:hypothetical protein
LSDRDGSSKLTVVEPGPLLSGATAETGAGAGTSASGSGELALPGPEFVVFDAAGSSR